MHIIAETTIITNGMMMAVGMPVARPLKVGEASSTLSSMPSIACRIVCPPILTFKNKFEIGALISNDKIKATAIKHKCTADDYNGECHTPSK